MVVPAPLVTSPLAEEKSRPESKSPPEDSFEPVSPAYASGEREPEATESYAAARPTRPQKRFIQPDCGVVLMPSSRAIAGSAASRSLPPPRSGSSVLTSASVQMTALK